VTDSEAINMKIINYRYDLFKHKPLCGSSDLNVVCQRHASDPSKVHVAAIAANSSGQQGACWCWLTAGQRHVQLINHWATFKPLPF